MSLSNKPHVFVIGNEKGGAGKTTCSMHLIASLLDYGYKVGSIDTDCRQHSLTTYISNRKFYNKNNEDLPLPCPVHFHISALADNKEKTQERLKDEFEDSLKEAISAGCDYIVIDTPGTYSPLSKVAHSYADTIITPINDSFLDLDVMGKIDPNNFSVISPSIYSQMVWEQKMQRAKRDHGSINWIVVRNRLNHLDAINKRNVGIALENLAKRISFKIAPGFSERVIFRELFLNGLTLLDIPKSNFIKIMNTSHVAARQELRDFLECLGIPKNFQKSSQEA